MIMINSETNFVKIIKEICKEEGIEWTSFSGDWIFRLQKDGAYRYIIGYQFGLNPCSVHALCCDKGAASEVMTSLGVPNVPHYYFMSPDEQHYIGKYGNWKAMEELLETYGALVLKPNEGTGGNLVFCVRNQYELEQAAFRIFKSYPALAVSPFYEIEQEYRVILLNGEKKLVYSKRRPYVVGDGESSVGMLLQKQSAGLSGKMTDIACDAGRKARMEELSAAVQNTVPKKGDVFYLSWKHNLGKGACAVLEEPDADMEQIRGILSVLSEQMGLKFASVDLIRCTEGIKVLEINSGVMMEYFSGQDENTYRIAKEIYREAVRLSFLA